MLDRWFHFGLWVGVIVTVAIMVINAVYMLVAPKAWFRLPRWLGLQGVLTSDRYGDGLGAIRIRVLGGVIIATVVWIASDIMSAIFK
jgi:hypothetical protein